MKPRGSSSVLRRKQSELRELARWPEKMIGGKYVQQLQGYVDGLRESDAHGEYCKDAKSVGAWLTKVSSLSF